MSTILELIEREKSGNIDKKVKKYGYIIGIPGLLYTKSIGKYTAVYIEKVDGRWESWRETFQKGKAISVSKKVIEINEDFEYVLLETENYFSYIAKKRRR